MTEYELAKEGLMRWIAGLALIVALLALGLQLTRPAGVAPPGPRYQIGISADGGITRLDTRTGEMVSFLVVPRGLYEQAMRRTSEYGDWGFFETARSAKEVQQ